MDLFEKILSEMPVRGIEKEIRGYNTNRFRDRDQKYLKTPKYDDIVTKKLERVPFDFYVYIVDTEATRDEIGLASNSARTFSLFYDPWNQDDRDKLLAMIGRRKYEMVSKNRGAVHMMITHNDPDSMDWMPLTPWMILHRLAHAVLDADQMGAKHIDAVNDCRKALNVAFDSLRDLESVLEDRYPHTEIYAEDVIQRVMPFKSARLRNSDHYEVKLELFVFYLWNGGHLKFRETGYPEIDAWSANLKKVMEPLFSTLIEEIKGVMWTG